MNQHWDQFIEDVSWFLHDGKIAEVGAARPPGTWKPASSDFEQLFPELDRLLRGAFVTSVAVAEARYELYAWLRSDGASCGWLSPLRSADPPSSVHPDHRVLLASFGGIVERSNQLDEEEEWWILNHNDVLTERVAQTDATFIGEHYAWAFEQAGVEIPIELDAFYAIAEEANGNTTFCHRRTGEIVLFAPDPGFDYAEPYPGCPEQSLYLPMSAPRFGDWVETIARQWRRWVEAAPEAGSPSR
jgi:hypothetical protein